jgi:flagellar motility protein MotE (MotC chaperone)
VNRGGAAAGNDANLKAQELARQQQDILMLRQQMDQRLKDMQNTEKKMQDMIREAKGLENEKVKRLILTYSNMKPKAAAKALENMEERVAIRILSGMTPKQSGEIMTYMEPVKTAKLTELITRMRITD